MTEPNDAQRDRQLKQYEQGLETYRHHFDLYIKTGAVFLAIAGTGFGIAFAPGTPNRLRSPLVGFIGLSSLLWIGAAFVAVKWVIELGRQLTAIEDELQLRHFNIAKAKGFGVLMAIGVGALALACVWYLVVLAPS